MIAGALWAILGACAWVSRFNTYISVVEFSGFVLLLDGLFLCSTSFTHVSTRKERLWLRAGGVVDMVFSVLLLLDPILTIFAFPYLIVPWLTCKGILEMVSAMTISRHTLWWTGDFAAGFLLILFGFTIAHDPMESPYGILTLMGCTGLTMGLLYTYDGLRMRRTNHFSPPRSGKSSILIDANHKPI